MKRSLKKISIALLFLTLVLGGLFSTITKPEAEVSFGPYTQKESDMRAVWVATVSNLNIGAQIGKGEKAINNWKKNYLEILDNAEANNLNTIIFQIRPANDAFYPSKYNPWSKYLCPDGSDPGWDPVAWMIEVTHERGLEYHAWLNPYRASVSTLGKSITKEDSVTGSRGVIDYDIDEYNKYKENYFADLREANPSISNPVLQTGSALYHDVLFGTEGKLILNPASENVQEHIKNTIEEIVDNYEIDGIHFDDYFYPATSTYKGNNAEYKGYTFSCEPSVDLSDYKAYLNETVTDALSIYDWRRENVNTLIKGLGELIREKNQTKKVKCAFGISPAARWAPTKEVCSSSPERGAEGGMSGGCYNYYSYSDLYADTYKWAKEEWIDYIVPQNYTNLDGDYSNITKWWYNALKGSKTKLYIGTALYQVSDKWSSNKQSEIYFQIRVNETKKYYVDGYVLFSYSSLLTSDGKNAMNPICRFVWKTDALTPLYEHYEYEKLVKEASSIKSITTTNNSISAEFTSVENAKGYGLFKFGKEETINFDVEHRIDLKLNNSTPFTFTKEDGYKYILVTYDNDNTIYSNYTVLDLDSKEPTVNVEIDKATYQPADKVNVKVTITDEDSTSFKVKVQYIDGTFKHKETSQNITDKNEVIINYELPKMTSETGFLLVTVEDEFNSVETQKQLVIANDLPKVTITMTDTFYYGDLVNVNVKVEDDSKELTYQILLSYENDRFMYLIGEGKVTPSNKEALFSGEFTSNTLSNEAKIKVIVNDGEHNVEEIFAFKVLEKQEESSKSGCSCKADSVIFEILTLTMMTSTVVLLLRKKGNK